MRHQRMLSPLTSTLTNFASATPLTSTLTKTKDLKSFNINTYKKRGGVPHFPSVAATLPPEPFPPSGSSSSLRVAGPRLPVETVARTLAFPQWTAHPLQTAWPVAHGTSTKSGTPIGKPARQMAATSWYFAYASNMSRAQMQSRAGNILEAQAARLENYEIVFNKKSHGGSAKAHSRPAAGEGVFRAREQHPPATPPPRYKTET